MTLAWSDSLAYGASVTPYGNAPDDALLGGAYLGLGEALTDGSGAVVSKYNSGVWGNGTFARGWVIDLGAEYEIVAVTVVCNVELSFPGIAATVTYQDWDVWEGDPGDVNVRTYRFDTTQTIRYLSIGDEWTNAAGSEYRGWVNMYEALIVPPVPPEPQCGVYADWDGDGFGLEGSDDDLTGDVASWRITRGASPEITGGAQPGTATVILVNPADDRYNPLNPAGPLYGKLRDGVPFWIGVNSDGAVTGNDPRGLFGGRIKDVTPVLVGGASQAPTVEITCEDALGWLGRTPVQLADGLYRTHAEFRAAILAAAGETRVVLPSEIPTVPISSWDGSALAALDALNKANGTRHFIRPADNLRSWYDYIARNRQWRLDGTVDATVLDAGADHVVSTDGWRLSADTVINQQKATAVPITWTSGQVTVWQAEALPFAVTSAAPWVAWVEFDDYVDGPTVDINYTGTAPTVALEAFGSTAKLTITTAGTTTVTGLSIEGRLARRGIAESAVADDTASQAGPRGIRAGSDISGDLVGVLANARGVAEHIVWRYGAPQYRPTLTVVNWIPEQFEIDLYDVIEVTIAQLGMTERRFEIVGITHESSFAASATAHLHVTTLVLQECRVQADPGWFVLDSSLLDGTDVLAY